MAANERQVGGTHYKVDAGFEEHWDRIWRLFGRGYFVGQITKYVERYAFKDGLKDLEKAKHFIEKLMELERGKVSPGFQYKQLPWPLSGVAQPLGFEAGEDAGQGYVNQDPPQACGDFRSRPDDDYVCANCGLGSDFHA